MLLYFTSGTTGQPKGVFHDYAYPLAHIVTAKYWQQARAGGLHFTVAETPSKGYHMELSTTHQSVARECDCLLREIMGFPPKLAARAGTQVLYLKQSEQIADLLTYLGAPVAAMGIMEARLEKELNNKVNRRCNCDDANTSKVVEAAQEQLAAIRLLRKQGKWDSLPGKLQQAAKAREDDPASNLTELAEMMDPPITKPAMSHRLKRLVEMSREVQS